MSQIEALMLVALGFVTALLIAMFAGRFLYVWSLHRAKRRLDRETPQTIIELRADRDRLRAEQAMLSRRLELKLNELRSRVTEQQAEVSRNRNRIEHLMQEVKKRDEIIAAREAEIGQYKQQVNPLESELAVRTEAVHEIKDQLHAREEAVARLTRELEAAAAQIEERDRLIESMEMTLPVGAAARPGEAAGERVEDGLRRRIDELTGLSQQIEAQHLQLNQQKNDFISLREEISRARQLPGENAATAAHAPATAEQLSRMDHGSRRLEQQLDEAQRETEALAAELRQLDQHWNDKLAELDAGIASTPEQAAPGSSASRSPKAPQASPVSNNEAANDREAAQPQTRARRGVANVISLAARIRALHKD